MFYSIIFCFLLFVELLYFRIAKAYNIVDQPNVRSSHTTLTIRGGGVLFAIAVLLFFFLEDFQYPLFAIGLIMISVISFLDDLLSLNNKVRLCIHLISVLMLISQWGLNEIQIYLFPIVIILIIGVINAYNFMDGINGITGIYSLVLVFTLYYINQHIAPIASPELFIFVGLSVLVFLFFNFRVKAKCFAGDVGSVSIAFIIVFLLGKLILQTQNYSYILLLLVYGLDAVVTIAFRLIRRENIFEAHRSHFYQYLANEKRIPHLYVSAGYGLMQLIINWMVLEFSPISNPGAIVALLISTLLFISIRFITEGKNRLIKKTPS